MIVVDALERGSRPCTLHVLEADVPDLRAWSDERRGDFLADMHYTTPTKAMILAKAVGVLPPKVYLVGCQPADANELGIGMSEVVQAGAERLMDEIGHLIAALDAAPTPS